MTILERRNLIANGIVICYEKERRGTNYTILRIDDV